LNEYFAIDFTALIIYFKFAMAWLICAVVFYSVLSYVLKKRWISISVSIGLSSYCYREAAILINHASHALFGAFLLLFFIILIAQAYLQAKKGKLGWGN